MYYQLHMRLRSIKGSNNDNNVFIIHISSPNVSSLKPKLVNPNESKIFTLFCGSLQPIAITIHLKQKRILKNIKYIPLTFDLMRIKKNYVYNGVEFIITDAKNRESDLTLTFDLHLSTFPGSRPFCAPLFEGKFMNSNNTETHKKLIRYFKSLKSIQHTQGVQTNRKYLQNTFSMLKLASCLEFQY